ncbi:MAG TPA: glutathione ABC transporter ATP-binding protein GsiA, partial [Cupriavidus sp.]|nr:glutathione ABC transporter ATP-binding protein GsiA [Cupriavidus sp.]
LPARFPLVQMSDTDKVVEEAPQDTIPAGAKPILRVRDLVTRFDVPGGLFGKVTRRVHAVEQVS